MIYLDYAAHTSIDKEVFDEMINISNQYPGSVNADYKIGKAANDKYNELCATILSTLDLDNHDLILTSGATESNNLAIKGVAEIYSAFGKHIISTPFEHSSTKGSLINLQKKGYDISFVEINTDGRINVDSLINLLKNDTILVSLCSVNSETGHIQDISKIAKNIKNFNNRIIIHVDATQGFGKIKENYSYCDLITASAHKLYGPTSGAGLLIRSKSTLLSPQIDGGKSYTPFRSATPDLVMLSAVAKCTQLSFSKIDENFEYVKGLYDIIINHFINKGFLINSSSENPYIINISTNINGEKLKDALAGQGIYISTKSSCESKKSIPNSVNIIYKDVNRAKNSIRISISHKTTYDDIYEFIKIFDKVFGELNG